MTRKTWILGTRGSQLALAQSQSVRQQLIERHPDIEVSIQVIKTAGDQLQDQPFRDIGVKGVFTREIEHCLLKGQIDLAVHSLKDMPSQLPEELSIAAIPLRRSCADLWISKNQLSLHELPAGAVVLTGALRRRAQILNLRNDLLVHEIRGNITTRLEKYQQAAANAVILAEAGLQRLDLQDWLRKAIRLDPAEFLPACGQGALAVQIRREDTQLQEKLAILQDIESTQTATAERSLLKHLDGGCHTPIGGHAWLKDNRLYLKAMVSDPQGTEMVRTQVDGTPPQAEELGQKAAQILLEKGARKIIEKLCK